MATMCRRGVNSGVCSNRYLIIHDGSLHCTEITDENTLVFG